MSDPRPPTPDQPTDAASAPNETALGGEYSMRTRDVAARLGVTPNRVRQLVDEGRIHPRRINGRDFGYRPADVEALAAIPRRSGIRRHPGGKYAGGAPKGNFNALGGRITRITNQGRLHRIRRELPPDARHLFDVAIIAAVRATGGDTPRQRNINRTRAIAAVVLATVEAWAAPARTDIRQTINLTKALKPWLELVGGHVGAPEFAEHVPRPRRRRPGRPRAGAHGVV